MRKEDYKTQTGIKMTNEPRLTLREILDVVKVVEGFGWGKSCEKDSERYYCSDHKRDISLTLDRGNGVYSLKVKRLSVNGGLSDAAIVGLYKGVDARVARLLREVSNGVRIQKHESRMCYLESVRENFGLKDTGRSNLDLVEMITLAKAVKEWDYWDSPRKRNKSFLGKAPGTKKLDPLLTLLQYPIVVLSTRKNQELHAIKVHRGDDFFKEKDSEIGSYEGSNTGLARLYNLARDNFLKRYGDTRNQAIRDVRRLLAQ